MRFALLLAGLLSSHTAFALDFQYQVADLGNPGGIDSEGYGLNNAGDIVGYYYVPSPAPKYIAPVRHAFLYSDGNFRDLGTLGGDHSVAFAINDNRQIAGYAQDGTGNYHAFLYAQGSMQSLNNESKITQGYAINSTGAVAGGYGHAHLFSGGASLDLGVLGGDESNALGINSQGQVVGWSEVPAGDSTRAFIYSTGSGMQDLSTLISTPSDLIPKEAKDINDTGQIIGIAAASANDGSNRGYIYSNGVIKDLSPGESVVPRAINSSGAIVGYSDRGAFLYTNGELFDLSSLLVTSDAEWQIGVPEDINDSKQIVATGRSPAGQHAILLLSPVPVITTNDETSIVTSRRQRLFKGKSGKATTQVFYRIGNRQKKEAQGKASWHFVTKLKRGKNVISVIARGPFGDSTPVKFIVRRK